MKTFILLLTFTCGYFISKAQLFAIINDREGFVNVRQDSSIHSSVVSKIYKDFVFGYDPDSKSKWVNIYKQNEDERINIIDGYIYRNRIFPLANFKYIKNKKSNKDRCVITNDSLTVVIKVRAFNAKKHKLLYGDGELIKIDNGTIWGTDGETPKKFISSVEIIKNGVNIHIPKSAFKNLFEPNFRSLTVYLGKNSAVYIEMDNSDGAGEYSIIWTIKNNQYFTRYIDNSNA